MGKIFEVRTMRIIRRIAVLHLIAMVLCAITTAQLHLEKEIPLPNVNGRLDHFSLDVARQYLFISALGNNSVEAVDIKRGERFREITKLREPQGVLYDRDSNRLFVANAEDGTLRSYDGTTFAFLKSVDLGSDADNVRYNSETKQVIVGYGDGGLAFFDSELKEISNIKLPVHPESFQLQKDGSHIFVNLPDASAIGIIGRNQNVTMWRVKNAAANFPMALDATNKRIFIGCRNPAHLLILDMLDGKTVAELPTVGDTDDLFYDEARHEIYVIGGEGFIDEFRQKDADHYEHVSRTRTSAGARTGFFAPALNRLFVAAPRRGAAARILVYRID
jgi:hypothetical protein